MSFHHIPIGEKYPDIVNAVIEIPKGGHNKYEYDEKFDVIRMNRVLHSPLFYPVDYGFIPETRAEDGDHLDILVLTDSPTFPGCFLEVKPIGVLNMSDENGLDYKILAVPTGNPHFHQFKSISDVDEHVLNEITHFFEQYKKLEKKEVQVDGWDTRDNALEIIRKTHSIFKNTAKN